jgi:hypothetical protein
MKIRWREHEMIFVTILVVIQIILSVFQFYHPENITGLLYFEKRIV